MIFFIISYLFLNVVSTFDQDRAICNTTESKIYPEGITINYTRTFCCQYFENVTGECKPCASGFTSINGNKCQKCNGNLYGLRCSLQCSCSETQSCDHVHGCVNLNGSTTYKIDDISHNTSYSYGTVTYASTTNSSKENIPGIETGTLLEVTSIGVTLRTKTEKPCNNTKGDLGQKIKFFSSGAFTILLTVAFIWCSCKIRRHLKTGATSQQPTQQTELQTYVSQYETIDESVLTSVSINQNILNIAEQDLTPSVLQFPDNSNEYYSRSSCDESSAIVNGNRSTGSHDSEYLNPYNTFITADLDIHVYQRAQQGDDGNGNNETNERRESYVNLRL